ncbi:hypothetical protein LKL35_28780 [Streptomyces sp. ET3-23]|uniref:hypothetical protein n=1 Tax=Streptomyces sp. ET3-23 TaxID=2885643 RepID=UPI001D12F6EA|nr:hypothetical protein [Streptomyces sp. ET3-23]MCC2279398.1 hypothetical protein [Streptomyces sp. ET3-23]
MADDRRYDWLDDDAVERLLRGEALAGTLAGDTADDRARDGAARLDAALGALRVPAPADDAPLPGEEAALAAFRTARAAERDAAAGSAAPVVRLGRTAAARTFLRRPARSARSALALALAGCALGGVAVAAGTGVLPAPFGRGGREPAPATSVVADSDTETGAPATGAPRTGPSHGTAGDGHGRSTAPSAPGSATPVPGTGSTAPDAAPGTVTPTPTPPAQDRDPGKDDGRKGDDGHPAVIAKLCRDYVDATRRNSGKGVDNDALSALERAAGGAAVRAYCDHVLGTSTSGGGSDDQGEDTQGNSGLHNPLRSVPHPLVGLPDLSRTPGVTFSEPLAL